MTRLRLPALFALALAACSQEPQSEETPSPTATPEAAPGREFKFTSLDDCPVIESNPDEGGYFESECPGEGGYKLKLIEFDLRQTLEVIAPGGTSTSLNLAAVTGGGFSDLGDAVEWRGTMKDGVFAPDALVLRHEVVTDPEGTEETSWLVAVKLAPAPCAVAKLGPGPGQNEKARAAADAGGACLEGTS